MIVVVVGNTVIVIVEVVADCLYVCVVVVNDIFVVVVEVVIDCLYNMCVHCFCCFVTTTWLIVMRYLVMVVSLVMGGELAAFSCS